MSLLNNVGILELKKATNGRTIDSNGVPSIYTRTDKNRIGCGFPDLLLPLPWAADVLLLCKPIHRSTRWMVALVGPKFSSAFALPHFRVKLAKGHE